MGKNCFCCHSGRAAPQGRYRAVVAAVRNPRAIASSADMGGCCSQRGSLKAAALKEVPVPLDPHGSPDLRDGMQFFLQSHTGAGTKVEVIDGVPQLGQGTGPEYQWRLR